MTDREYLLQTVRLARQYAGQVAPKPAVGALLVKDRKVIAKAAYKNPRGPHAEAKVLQMAGRRAEGATLYVLLEPCTFWKGKLTASCAKLVARSKVAGVVVGLRDLRPEVNGQGLALLQRAGKKVTLLNLAQAKNLFAPYLLWLKRRQESYRKPQVLMKTAMSIDGKIASVEGSSLRISSPQDIRAVQKLRAQCDAIIVGGRTLLKDDPRLTVRDQKLIVQRVRSGLSAQPIKVAIISDASRLKVKSRFCTTGSWRRIIFTTSATPPSKVQELKRVADVFVSAGRRVDLQAVMRVLWNYGARRVILEGGGTLNFEMLKAGLVDALRISIAPFVVGGKDTTTLTEGQGFLFGAFPQFTLQKIENLGETVVLWYRKTKR